MIVYTESQKLADLILSTTNVGKLISDASDRLEYLVISSLPADVPYRYENDEALTISLSFSMSNSNTLDPLVELACGLPDVLNELKLTSDVSLSSVPKKKICKVYADRIVD